jgi:hypothetical protein
MRTIGVVAGPLRLPNALLVNHDATVSLPTLRDPSLT